MRVRLTVMRVPERILWRRPRSVAREAGANPARTRHCDRASPPLAAIEPQPLARSARWEGAEGSSPGARRPPPTAKHDTPSRKGVAPLHNQPRAGLTVGLLVLSALAAPAALAAGPKVSVRVEGANKTLLAPKTVT